MQLLVAGVKLSNRVCRVIWGLSSGRFILCTSMFRFGIGWLLDCRSWDLRASHRGMVVNRPLRFHRVSLRLSLRDVDVCIEITMISGNFWAWGVGVWERGFATVGFGFGVAYAGTVSGTQI